MEPLELNLTLIPSAGDGLLYSAAYQKELKEFSAELKQQQVVARAREAPQTASSSGSDSSEKASDGSPLIGEFILKYAPAVLASSGFTGIVTAWIARRNGRKVRLKVGEIEVEAATIEEAEKLLARALEILQSKQQPKVIV
jgi:hypothetical protein